VHQNFQFLVVFDPGQIGLAHDDPVISFVDKIAYQAEMVHSVVVLQPSPNQVSVGCVAERGQELHMDSFEFELFV
jgi:hypothetical protein